MSPNAWTGTGNYLVIVQTGQEIRFQTGVSISNGSGTVDFASMTEEITLP
jgi:aconitase B